MGTRIRRMLRKCIQSTEIAAGGLALAGAIQALRSKRANTRSPSFRQAASFAMTADPDTKALREPSAAHEPARRGSIVLVLLVAAGVVAAALALMTIGRAQAQPYIVGLLALLSM